MKCLFLNTYYENFLKDHYSKNKIEHLEYMEQWDSIQSTKFGDSDFYSFSLEKQGWMAHDLITNCNPLQKAWAKENDYNGGDPIWVEQIRHYKPDVVYTQGTWLINDETYPLIKPYCKVIAGQTSTQCDNFYTDKFDVIFTAVPSYVDEFRKVGVNSYYLALAFDDRITFNEPKIYGVTFVGQLSGTHSKRKKVINAVSKVCDLKVWAGEKWGMDMYRIMAQSLITINCHIDHAPPYVGNMRMFEATGCGACLVTDNGINMQELFHVDEVLAYDTPEEAAATVEHYLNFPKLAGLIAKQGQRRTLKEHTYEKRMEKVDGILRDLLQ